MNLKEQTYVCVLAECGNITRAASKLFISQPALSIYISNLEKSLGVSLFERQGKRFSLTYAGERYVEAARKMLELKDQFDQELLKISGSIQGRVRIGVQLRRAPWLLPPVIAEFKREYPDVEVILREGTRMELNAMHAGHELDLILDNVEQFAEDMEYREIYRERTLMAVPPLHPLNEKAEYVAGSRYRSMDIRHLEGEHLILQRSNQSIRREADRMLEEYRVKPGSIQVIRNIETAMQMVAEGLGIGFNREGYAANMRYAKRVNYYIIGNEDNAISVSVFHKKGAELPPYMERLMELLEQRGAKFT